MCGIAGFIGRSVLPAPRISSTLELMRRRGPDHQDSKEIVEGEISISLLHSRLSIIDLDPRSNQPFSRGSSTVIFNGEIYNYVELRRELQKLGHQFSTNSDTEVLLGAWQEWGEDCVTRFEGMWAFAIFDRARRVLFLSRDRFGEKPLYLYRASDGLYFGSEIRYLSQLAATKFSVNSDQVLRFLVYGYRALHFKERTFFSEIEELAPACNLSLDLSLSETIKRYWTPSYSPATITQAEAIEGLRHHLSESLRIRLRSDVPLAFCLSGGVDSGSLISLATKVHGCSAHCYSIVDRDERYDESDMMAETVRDTNSQWTRVNIEGERGLERLNRLIVDRGAPVYTTSYFVHSFLSEKIHLDGRRVAFSGTGADELFTGYYDHFHYHLFDIQNDPALHSKALEEWKRCIKPVCRNPALQDPGAFVRDPNFRENLILDAGEFRQFLRKDFSEAFFELKLSESLLKNRMLNEISHETIRPILHEDDLNSMFYSIENRSPYLDSKLCEFAMSIPVPLLIQNGYGKFLLREAMAGILNDPVRLSRQKKGFNADILSVFDLKSGVLRDVLLEDSPLFDYVDRKRVEHIIGRESYQNSFSKFVFSLISVKLFLEAQQ